MHFLFLFFFQENVDICVDRMNQEKSQIKFQKPQNRTFKCDSHKLPYCAVTGNKRPYCIDHLDNLQSCDYKYCDQQGQ